MDSKLGAQFFIVNYQFELSAIKTWTTKVSKIEKQNVSAALPTFIVRVFGAANSYQ